MESIVFPKRANVLSRDCLRFMQSLSACQSVGQGGEFSGDGAADVSMLMGFPQCVFPELNHKRIEEES
jgi:hypothetical protein